MTRPRLARPGRPPFTVSPLQVWAVEDSSLQLAWGDLPPGPVVAEVRHADRPGSAPLARVEIEHSGAAGLIEVAGLQANRALEVDVTWRGTDRSPRTHTLGTRTLAAPPGPELFRFATVSDLHLGAGNWGFLKTMTDAAAHEHPDPYPLRCARAAISEAAGWGAQLLVIKGDLVQHRSPADFAVAGALIDAFPDLPMMLIPGNHDVDLVRSDMDLPALGSRKLTYVTDAAANDVPGARILVADTTIRGRGDGTLERTGAAVLDLATCDRPVFVGLHHHFHRYGVVTHWPLGIPKSEADAFFPALRRVNPLAFVTSGHSHRDRLRTHHGIACSEVASTKDWPGVWAGYVVHEGGIRQVVRKVSAAVDWHEYSRGAVFGLWGAWAPGRLDERCFGLDWTTPR